MTKFSLKVIMGDWILSMIFSLLFADAQQCGKDFAFANYYADHMVLQQGPAHARVWGYGFNVLDEVTLKITVDRTEWVYTTLTSEGAAGRAVWAVELAPVAAGGPYNISVTSGGCTLTLYDVLFGDVWVCSGQSNMALPLHSIHNASEALADVINYPNVRIFETALHTSDTPLEDIQGLNINWTIPTPDNAKSFSAVCWLYGRNLYRKYKRPIGLLQTAWGGTRVEAWSPPTALRLCFPDGPSKGDSPQNIASALYNAMIHPYFPMPIFGAIWYQGEANTHNYWDYGCSIQQMVTHWRMSWFANSPTMHPQFPFGEVQLAPHDPDNTNRSVPGTRWEQTHNHGYLPNADLPRFFMAVTIDTPDLTSPMGSVHTRYKRPVADRLALAGYAVAYGDTSEGLWQGPLPTHFALQSTNMTITLANGAVELEVRDTQTAIHYEVCCASSASAVCNATADNDTRMRWANTTFLSAASGRVTVSVPCDVTHEYIVGVRYAWRENPCPILMQCPIYSKENGLPAPPYFYSGLIQ